jgi:YVTN family beta-propeller protein
MRRLSVMLVGLAVLVNSASWAADSSPLTLETKIPLGEVKGRIDHFAADANGQRMFVAELGNNSIGVVDLRTQKVVRTIAGLSEPQGVGFVPSADILYVANAGDGSVHLYRGTDFSPAGRIDLGDDADNVRIDVQRNHVLVGYGSGALAVIDPSSQKKIADIALKAHPESFQLDETGSKIFANVPDARQIAIVDVATGKQTSALSPAGARSSFPMAIDADEHRVLVVFRNPPKLMVFGTQDSKQVGSIDVCGDADDVFVDSKRHRVYVSCGEGVIDVLAQQGSSYERIARIPTVSGARTSLFMPVTDRLYVGVRAASGEPAAVWVFRPRP